MSSSTPAPHTMRGQRAVNVVVRTLLRTPGIARIIGKRLVVLSVVGRTSGRRYDVPVAYLADGDRLLIGSSFPWTRNLRTGDRIEIRLRGRRRTADVQVETEEADVVAAYARMTRANPTFASFNGIKVHATGDPDPDDLHRAWLAGARAVRLTPH